MPYSATSAAATSSCVESGLLAASVTCAPPALSVRIRLAVSVVTWRQAPTRRPSSGRSRSRRSRLWSGRRSSSSVSLLAVEQPAQWRGDGGPRRAEAVGQALLEADVLLVAQPAVGVEGGRIVGPDVEHDLVARPEQLRGHRP